MYIYIYIITNYYSIDDINNIIIKIIDIINIKIIKI